MTNNEHLISYENIFKVDYSNYSSNESEKSFLQNISIKSEEFENIKDDDENDEKEKHFCEKCEKNCLEFSISINKDKDNKGMIYCEVCDNIKLKKKSEKIEFYPENYFTDLKKQFEFFANYNENVRNFEEKLDAFIDEQFLIVKKNFKQSLKDKHHFSFDLKRIKEDVKIFEKLIFFNELTKEDKKDIKNLLNNNKQKVEQINKNYLEVIKSNEAIEVEMKNLFKKIQNILQCSPDYKNNKISNFQFSLNNEFIAKKSNRDHYSSENNIIYFMKKPNSYIKSVKTHQSPLKPSHQKTKSFNIFHQQFQNRMTEVNESKNVFARLIENNSGLEVIKENIENIQLVNNTIN